MSKKANSKKQKSSLGRLLIKDRFKNQPQAKHSWRHTAELDDEHNYNAVNFNSITEQTDVENFLTTAEIAGKNFKADKLNAKIVIPTNQLGVISVEERKKINLIQKANKENLRIPRRPPWDRSMDTVELNESEREIFLTWRRDLALLQEVEGIILTPYEKNLEFWRQLWRVIERSDVVVQIVDARNPLMFRCDDLVSYVKEVDPNKENLLLVNKADFLTESQRETWASYFIEENIKAVFYSATLETTLDKIEEEEEEISLSHKDTERNLNHLNNEDDVENDINMENEDIEEEGQKEDIEEEGQEENEDIKEVEENLSHVNNSKTTHHCQTSIISGYIDYINTSKLLNREELISLLTHFYTGPKLNLNYVTIGLVGYPNVGKSSTINSLMLEKKVSVSATPGKTKHFQTLFLSDNVMLCDCPGLVFPAFVSTKEEMIISGILSIDEMRYHVPPMNLLLSLIPRHALEQTYGVKIPPPPEGEDPDRYPTSEEFLTVYGHMRGFMTQRGIPDHPRSARYVLKDYINGKLLYCHSPPGVPQDTFHLFILDKIRKIPTQQTPQQLSLVRDNRAAIIDAHITGKPIPTKVLTSAQKEKMSQKPWRTEQKLKRNSKQKLRIKFSHLDQ